MPDFAQRFRELRGPLTQRVVSYRLDVTEGMVGKWERGSVQPSLETLHRIADATGASIDYITGRSDEFSGPPAWWAGPDSPTADLDAAVQQRRRGDGPPRAPARQRRP